MDIESWGYQDARLLSGSMSQGEIQQWTAAIDNEPPTELVRPSVSSDVEVLRR